MNDEVSEWQSVGSTPIRPDAPAGLAARYEPEYEEIQAEIAKLEGLSEQRTDWKKVVALGREILQKKSKDLLIASYVCLGRLEEGGYGGLMSGLACLEGMISNFWEPLYPEAKRMRGRIGVLTWLSEKVGASAARRVPEAPEKDTVKVCLERVQTLEKLLDEKMGAESPGLGELRRALQEHLQRLESPQSRPEAQAAGADQGVSSSAAPRPAAQTAAVEIRSPEDVRRVLKDSAGMVRRAVTFTLAQDPQNPWPYRITRTFAWLQMDAVPPHSNGRTRIPPPAPPVVKRLENLREQGAWADLLVESESNLWTFPFWLDLNRFTALALTGLGSAYSRAGEAVRSELAGFVRNLPDLLSLEFSSGQPFADEETRKWMETIVEPPGQAVAGSVSSKSTAPSGGQAAPSIKLHEGASALLREGKLKEAVALFHQEMTAADSRRTQFLERLELARLCLDAGHVKAAVSQLEMLDQDILVFRLEEWEPALSLEVLQTLWKSLNRLVQDSKQAAPELIRNVDDVFKRLCRLDLVAALDLESKKKTGWFSR